MTKMSGCIFVLIVVAAYLFAGDGLRAMPLVKSVGDTDIVLAKAKPKSAKTGGHSMASSKRADQQGKKSGKIHSGVSSIMIKK